MKLQFVIVEEEEMAVEGKGYYVIPEEFPFNGCDPQIQNIAQWRTTRGEFIKLRRKSRNIWAERRMIAAEKLLAQKAKKKKLFA